MNKHLYYEELLMVIVQNTQIPEIYFKLSILNKAINRKSKEVVTRNRERFVREIITKDGEIYFVLPNGKKEGIYRKWHMDDAYYMLPTEMYKKFLIKCKLHILCNYSNGNKDGLYQQWYSNGNIWIECNYVNDQRDGAYLNWYSNGKILIQCNYLNNIKNGTYLRWHDNGNLWVECQYVNGEKESYNRWDVNGKKSKCNIV